MKRNRFATIALVVFVILILIFGIEFLINGYFYPRESSFESRGTGWILEKGTSEFEKSVDVSFSGEKSYYIFKQGEDGIQAKIVVNGKNVLLDDEFFLGKIYEDKEYFDASFSTENIDLVISKDAECFIMLLRNDNQDRLDVGEDGTKMLIYPANSKKQAFEKLWEVLSKSTTLQRRLVELDWE